jgi:transposase
MPPIDWPTYGKIRAMSAAGGMSGRAIARALGVGRRTVAKYKGGAATPGACERDRPAPIRESIEGDIKRMLDDNAGAPRKQRLSARGIWEELMRSGYAVSESHVRRIVQGLRASGGEEFIPLLHEAGASIQFDWGDAAAFIGGEKTAVSVFTAVLPHSHAVCAFAYPDKKWLSFAHGHVSAFSWFGGVPRQSTYDNLSSAVLDGYGNGAEKNAEFMRLEAHYGFNAVFCNRSSGWEKSNVENGVKISRNKAFTPMPRVDSWDGLQKHIGARMLEYNMKHRIEGEPMGIWRASRPSAPRSCRSPRRRWSLARPQERRYAMTKRSPTKACGIPCPTDM